MKKKMAILGGKTFGKVSRLFGHQGSTIPGVVALKIDPNILIKLSKHINQLIFITGTNGKTTTSNLLAHLLRSTGKKILNNSEGSNMLSGITACFINQAPLFGILKYDYAVLEVDEASLPVIVKQIAPQMIIITNFFRDQLDRYGEIDILIKDIINAVDPIDTKLFLNVDDPLVFRLNLPGKDKVFYGLSKDAYCFGDYGMSDSKYCPTCGEEIQYEYIHFSQLGLYSCTCGFKRPEPHYEINNVQNSPLSFKLKDDIYEMNITGAYNVYNALAAIACAAELGVQPMMIRESLYHYHSENGRMQLFYHQGFPYIVNLSKNPSGTNVSLSEILSTQHDKQIVLCLNDLVADGEDVSWIWDVDYECLQRKDITRIICSGRRAADLSLRLKYASINQNKLIIIPTIEKALQYTYDHPMPTYILPTYTALHQVMSYMTRSVNKKNEVSSI
ncbi:MurT ligase domain-containing protein [Paenibacillus sp. N3.4]|uniref:MurT ligase domain-containing protein n=1 Tax=Paenibacillus sp. N3.4 TaxID=2603222 RepID=UPI00164F17F0|nr:MurT ligase domain-containing protein [Paenibacillus sp. N3.4]